MPMFQYDKHVVHCVLDSVSNNSQISMLPTSRIIFLILDWKDWMIDFVVDLVEKHVDLGGSQFFESILERWYSAHASQWNVVVLEFGGPCSLRSALFVHDLNCHDQQRVSPFLHEVFGSPTLNVSLTWQERVWELSDTFSVFVPTTSLLVLSCAVPTLGSLLSSNERAWITLVSTMGLPVLTKQFLREKR